ncbi:MAG TPA: hypothetical protein VFS33_11010 [Gemmatimonadales bacterium]|nr:hypothetical protein [Gemmatimonadales bacterium]
MPRQSQGIQQAGLTASSGELRARTYAFGRQLSLGIERTADSIMSASSDPGVRRHVVLWQASAIPALQEAVLAPDPLIAAMDLYAYCLQTRDYFDHGDGAALFGDAQPIAQSRLPRLVSAAHEFLDQVVQEKRVQYKGAQLEEWARAHPIRGTGAQFYRESLVGDWAEVFGSQGAGAFATLGQVSENVELISERLRFVNETGLKQVRWSARLLADEFASGLPEFVRAERRAVVDDLRAERIATMREIDRQRALTIGALHGERRAAFADLSQMHFRALTEERVAVLDALRGERSAVLDAIRAERIAALASIDSMVQRSLDQSNGIIDHAVWRLGQLLVVLIVIIGLFVLLAIWVWRRTGPHVPV